MKKYAATLERDKNMAQIVEIVENGRVFVGYLNGYGDCNNWERKDADRHFKYKRCSMCGRLVPKHANHWWGHYDACIKKHKVIGGEESDFVQPTPLTDIMKNNP